MIFESHAHYEDKKFDMDRDKILGEIGSNGLETVINVGSTMETSARCIELAQQYPRVYAAIGVHPSEIDCMDDRSLEWLTTHGTDPKVVAIGEIGLDYYWDKDKEVQQRQIIKFQEQLDVAQELDLPVIIHSRDASEATFAILAKRPQIRGVIHCYSSSVEMAREYVKKGFYIGIGGVVTFKNGRILKEVAADIPLDRILTETDSPYMAPEPYRGQRNSSLLIPYVIDKIAQLRGITSQEVEEQTRQNGYKLFTKVQPYPNK